MSELSKHSIFNSTYGYGWIQLSRVQTLLGPNVFRTDIRLQVVQFYLYLQLLSCSIGTRSCKIWPNISKVLLNKKFSPLRLNITAIITYIRTRKSAAGSEESLPLPPRKMHFEYSANSTIYSMSCLVLS